MTNQFSVKLKEFRILSGLSKNKLAREAGVDPSYIHRLENANRTPSRSVVEQLISALKLDFKSADELRILAGFAPSVRATGLHSRSQGLVQQVSVLLEDDLISEEDIRFLEEAINLIGRRQKSSEGADLRTKS